MPKKLFEKGNQFWKLRTKHGRDKLFSSPEILWEEAIKYFESVDERKWNKTEYHGKDPIACLVPNTTPYTWSGLELYLGINSFEEYKTNPSYSDFSDVIARIGKIIYTQKIEGASVGAFNASIVARELGLADKQEITKNKITVKRKNDRS